VDHRDWIGLAEIEYGRLRDVLRTLGPVDWVQPTERHGWNVRAVVVHLLANALAAGSPIEQSRQLLAGERLRRDRPELTVVEAVNEVQQIRFATVTPPELLERFPGAVARSLSYRRWLPFPLRQVPIQLGEPFGSRPMGYLLGPVHVRDAWLHRIDVCRASGRALRIDAWHDGAIVRDIAEEWADGHGRPVELLLDGPAGGRYHFAGQADVSAEPERIQLDAIEFCRIVAGGAPGDGLLGHGVNACARKPATTTDR
jgi:uncharacterized protein (TIGR03083 family)